jgi:chromosome segregation ATPase
MGEAHEKILANMQSENARLRAELAAEREAHNKTQAQIAPLMRFKWNDDQIQRVQADNDALRAELAAERAAHTETALALGRVDAERDEARAALAAERERSDKLDKWVQSLISHRDAAIADGDKLRAALEPFAEAAQNFDDFPIKDAEQWFAYSGTSSQKENGKGAITVGDLRRARAVLVETGGGDE